MISVDDHSGEAAPTREVILCVDDEESVLSVLKEQLEERFGDRCEVESASSGPAALDLIGELESGDGHLAVVVADQIMPGMKGTELLRQITERYPRTLKILLTGQAGLDAVIYAINNCGLNQYLSKPWDEEHLSLAVAGLLDRYRLSEENGRLLHDLHQKNAELSVLNSSLELLVHSRTRELEDANARLAKLAVTDGLTGLYNHRHFQEQLEKEVARAKRSGEPLSLLMIDVDHFKLFNDAQGHQAGDAVLEQVAKILSTGRRLNDLVARYGGEEFAIILPGTDKRSAALVAEYLRRRVADSGFDGEQSQPGGRLTMSLGVACYPADAEDARGLIRAADGALYGAKDGGRDRVNEA